MGEILFLLGTLLPLCIFIFGAVKKNFIFSIMGSLLMLVFAAVFIGMGVTTVQRDVVMINGTLSQEIVTITTLNDAYFYIFEYVMAFVATFLIAYSFYSWYNRGGDE